MVKPEKVQAFDVGYRSVINNDLSVDINGYYNIYNDFLNQSSVITPYYGTVGTDPTNLAVQQTYAAIANGDRRIYQVYTNSKAEVTSCGFGIGLSKKVYKDFEISANYNYAEFTFDQAEDPSFHSWFQYAKTPSKSVFGKSRNCLRISDSMSNVRWNYEYLWQSSFADGMVPENTVFDAQINYAIPTIKISFKVGGK